MSNDDKSGFSHVSGDDIRHFIYTAENPDEEDDKEDED